MEDCYFKDSRLHVLLSLFRSLFKERIPYYIDFFKLINVTHRQDKSCKLIRRALPLRPPAVVV